MNKKTVALTTDQYKEIIQTMKQGFCGCRPNERIAHAVLCYYFDYVLLSKASV